MTTLFSPFFSRIKKRTLVASFFSVLEEGLERFVFAEPPAN
jgi:hypothetical protein